MEAGDEAIDDVAVFVVVFFAVGGYAVRDGEKAAGEKIVCTVAVGIVGEKAGSEVENLRYCFVNVRAFEK